MMEKTKTVEKPIKTLAEAIKKYNSQGGHFFSPDTMEFWGTKLKSGLYPGRIFITSELDFNGENRFFNVRQFSPDFKRTRTLSEFNVLKTKEEAVELIRHSENWVKTSF